MHYLFTKDIQPVKWRSVIQASKVYYKTRLEVHIVTIFSIAAHQVTINYVWNEFEGDL